jgi:hypothetical protein
MIITSDGNVGIGTTTPGARLTVRQDASGAPFLIRLQNLLAGNEADFTLKAGGDKFIIGDERDSAERFTIDTNGNVGIGTTSPSYKLDVSGNARISDTLTVKSGTWGINSAGDLYIDANSGGTGTVYLYDNVSIPGNLNVGGRIYGWNVPSDVKVTTATHNGNFGSYEAMNDWIQTNGCSGYHVCDIVELTRWAQTGGAVLGGIDSWYNGDSYDCYGWRSANSADRGATWWAGIHSHTWSTCDTARNVACCK